MGFHHTLWLHDRGQKTRYCDKVKKETMITDVAISGDKRVCDKEREKIEKFSLPKDETARLWQMKKVVVIPIVVGAFRNYNSKFWEVSWKPWKWDQNWTFSEISIVRSSWNNKKGTIFLSTQERILLWYLWHLVDICSHSKNQR